MAIRACMADLFILTVLSFLKAASNVTKWHRVELCCMFGSDEIWKIRHKIWGSLTKNVGPKNCPFSDGFTMTYDREFLRNEMCCGQQKKIKLRKCPTFLKIRWTFAHKKLRLRYVFYPFSAFSLVPYCQRVYRDHLTNSTKLFHTFGSEAKKFVGFSPETRSPNIAYSPAVLQWHRDLLNVTIFGTKQLFVNGIKVFFQLR